MRASWEDYLFNKHTLSLTMEDWRTLRTDEYFWVKASGVNAFETVDVPTTRTHRLNMVLKYKGFSNEEIYKIKNNIKLKAV